MREPPRRWRKRRSRDGGNSSSPGLRVVPGKYLSVISYKRDGTAVATPVWFVQQDGRLLVQTDANSGKVKRIRRNPAVRVAACTASGRLHGEQFSAMAQVLPESEVSGVERLIMRRYRLDMMIIKPVRFIQSALHIGRPRTKPVIVAITPSRATSGPGGSSGVLVRDRPAR